ncbi:alpha/beta hydrolase family protein [Bythopirellula polymerisocia]|nr:acetylxylan esterase [Bythopirellula polymerisocia]
MRTFLISLALILTLNARSEAQYVTPPKSPGDKLLADYFRNQVSELTVKTFAEIDTLEEWTSHRPEYRRQLLEMLGLDPMPTKTLLDPVVMGTVESEGVLVERLHFQSMPGLYVTANLYRPAQQQGPLPAILYVCGHTKAKIDGVSLGNKTRYQHHGLWFARNGYVCLVIDTIQLGEIEGIHHGTYRKGMWWWNNRGYTPAGVEAWNCIRSLDYLQSRDEVDGDRIGVTGRSGGGAYTCWIAAIDDRVKVAVPVAGITSMKNHIVDGCVEGHCDCMYMVNTYRWDFSMVAALIAPRPLLIANSDKDRIFPLDGVVDVYSKAQRIYSLYGAKEKLGLYITEGPHKDTQEIRIGAFRWLNRFLKGDESLIEMAAKPAFDLPQLKVFETLPKDEMVTTIQESFISNVGQGDVKTDSQADVENLINELKQRTFGGWPQHPAPLNTKVTATKGPNTDARMIEYTSQDPYRLSMYYLKGSSGDHAQVNVIVLDEAAWRRYSAMFVGFFPKQFQDTEPDQSRTEQGNTIPEASTVFIVPRGVGPTAWTGQKRERIHIRRRFMLLGQTQAAMQIYDVRRGLESLRQLPEFQGERINLVANGEAAVWAVYASLFVDGIASLEVTDVPIMNRDAPDLLNVSRVAELSDVLRIAKLRLEL